MKLIKFVLLLLIISPLSAAQSEPPPYLYYYSRMLGGIIIERADGTDSRIIGQDVIPAGLTGIAGPGWSPSGKYFAGYGIDYEYGEVPKNAFLIDHTGNNISSWLQSKSAATYKMEWSPEEDLLFVMGTEGEYSRSNHQYFLWIVNAQNGFVLSETGASIQDLNFELGDIQWDLEKAQVVLYIASNLYPNKGYYRLAMQFDGSVAKESVTRSEFLQHFTPPDFNKGEIQTGNENEFHRHSQGTICRAYAWHTSGEYTITMDGTFVAGGGNCRVYSSVLGVTDKNGDLWRELGGCSWNTACINWLPPQVNVEILPEGQSEPIQLDPVHYEDTDWGMAGIGFSPYRLNCYRYVEQNGATKYIVDVESEKILYQLRDLDNFPCEPDYTYAENAWRIAAAHEPKHNLLATYTDYNQQVGVSIWQEHKGIWHRINQLNTYGSELEFTSDGKYLRARNLNAWKIYSVEEILRTATSEIPSGN